MIWGYPYFWKHPYSLFAFKFCPKRFLPWDVPPFQKERYDKMQFFRGSEKKKKTSIEIREMSETAVHHAVEVEWYIVTSNDLLRSCIGHGTRFFKSWPRLDPFLWPFQGWKRDLHLGNQFWSLWRSWLGNCFFKFPIVSENLAPMEFPMVSCIIDQIEQWKTIWSKLAPQFSCCASQVPCRGPKKDGSQNGFDHSGFFQQSLRIINCLQPMGNPLKLLGITYFLLLMAEIRLASWGW